MTTLVTVKHTESHSSYYTTKISGHAVRQEKQPVGHTYHALTCSVTVGVA